MQAVELTIFLKIGFQYIVKDFKGLQGWPDWLKCFLMAVTKGHKKTKKLFKTLIR